MRSSHETADPRLVEVLTAEAPSAIHWLEELGCRVHARERRLPARALRRRVAQAAPPGRRPDGPRDHEGAARGVRGGGRRRRSPNHRLAALEPATGRLARDLRAPAGTTTSTPATVVLAAGGRCFAEAEDARRALDEPPERDRRGDADRARRRRRGARPRRAPVPPERRRVARDDAGLLDSRDDARVRRRAAERRRRGVHRLARPARRGRRRRSSTRSRQGEGVETRGRPARRLARHDAHRASTTPRSRCRTCCAATAARASTRSPSRSSRTPSSTTRTAAS